MASTRSSHRREWRTTQKDDRHNTYRLRPERQRENRIGVLGQLCVRGRNSHDEACKIKQVSKRTRPITGLSWEKMKKAQARRFLEHRVRRRRYSGQFKLCSITMEVRQEGTPPVCEEREWVCGASGKRAENEPFQSSAQRTSVGMFWLRGEDFCFLRVDVLQNPWTLRTILKKCRKVKTNIQSIGGALSTTGGRPLGVIIF